MRLADVALLSVLGLLAWSQWQEWRLNRTDAIDIAYHGVPTVSLWQCAILTQRMTALAEHGGELAFRFRGGADRDGTPSAQGVATTGVRSTRRAAMILAHGMQSLASACC